MNKKTAVAKRTTKSDLFSRVVSILEQARTNVVRTVNTQMTLAYWHIGREIVLEIQGGEDRAAYGKKIIDDLSAQLTKKYRTGFSTTNLKYFRLFYLVYAERKPQIRHEPGDELSKQKAIGHEPSDELVDSVRVLDMNDTVQGFSPALSWTHYRTLLGVENKIERSFYEIEAEKTGWSVPELEHQIHTFLFARLLKSRNKKGAMELATRGQEILAPIDVIKQPYVLDFLDLPDGSPLHETKLETAIIDKLQPFLLELGKGFAFVARQYRVATEKQHFYIDLVFYNYHLKCFILIDLKMGKLTHQDIGQIDMYVRMFDELQKGKTDNPSVGLVLCAEKDDVVAKYSVLKNSKQLFASKYMLYLPTEDELKQEIDRERRLIEAKGAFNGKIVQRPVAQTATAQKMLGGKHGKA